MCARSVAGTRSKQASHAGKHPPLVQASCALCAPSNHAVIPCCDSWLRFLVLSFSFLHRVHCTLAFRVEDKW